jgi:hypothetical protein
MKKSKKVSKVFNFSFVHNNEQKKVMIQLNKNRGIIEILINNVRIPRVYYALYGRNFNNQESLIEKIDYQLEIIDRINERDW